MKLLRIGGKKRVKSGLTGLVCPGAGAADFQLVLACWGVNVEPAAGVIRLQSISAQQHRRDREGLSLHG